MGRGEVHTGFWYGILKERGHLEGPGIDMRVILKWIFKKWDRSHELDCAGSRQGHVVCCCECGNELTGSIKCGEFLN
jgi:hypothetical protein